jgi:hypothetical protein
LDLGHPDRLLAGVVVEGHLPVEGEAEYLVAFGIEAVEQVRCLRPLATRLTRGAGGCEVRPAATISS